MINNEILTFQLTCPAGEGQVRATEDHPLLAPYRKAITEGTPTGKRMVHLYTLHAESPTPIILGTLLLTEGLRLLFYQGTHVVASSDDARADFERALLDHITLERPTGHAGYSSHVALRDGTRTLRLKSRVRPGLKVPFLSLLVPSLDGFARLPRELTLEFPSPRPDTLSFGKALAIEGNNLLLPIPEAAGPDSSFIQFDFWVGRDQDEWTKRGIRSLPWVGKQGLFSYVPAEQSVKANRIDYAFRPDYGVTIAVTRPMGKLEGLHLLRPGLAQDASLHNGGIVL